MLKKIIIIVYLILITSLSYAGFGGHKATVVKPVIKETIIKKTVINTVSANELVNVFLVVVDTKSLTWEIRSNSQVIFVDTKTLKMQTKNTKSLIGVSEIK